MKKNPVALLGLALWLTLPGAVVAAPRPFDFAPRVRTARLLERPQTRGMGMAEGNRIRALSHDASYDSDIPTHVWLVPLILTGAGLAAGLAVCAGYEGGGSGCSSSILTGIGVGVALGLAYLRLVSGDVFDDDTLDLCSDEDEECLSVAARRPRALKSLQTGSARTRFTLPLGIAPSMGVVNDRAVMGLGGHF